MVQTYFPWTLARTSWGEPSAPHVALVAWLAGVMQFLARAELLLGCKRQLGVPLANEAGLIDAHNARLPPALGALVGKRFFSKRKFVCFFLKKPSFFWFLFSKSKNAKLNMGEYGIQAWSCYLPGGIQCKHSTTKIWDDFKLWIYLTFQDFFVFLFKNNTIFSKSSEIFLNYV